MTTMTLHHTLNEYITTDHDNNLARGLCPVLASFLHPDPSFLVDRSLSRSRWFRYGCGRIRLSQSVGPSRDRSWAYGLIRDAGAVLPISASTGTAGHIRARLEAGQATT